MPADLREKRSPADGATAKVGELSAGARSALRELDKQHHAFGEHVDVVVKATKVATRLSAPGAAVAAPTGLTDGGVALGLVSARSEGGQLATAASLIHTTELHALDR